MTQDRASGAAANDWGLTTARAIASQIGAVMKSRASNEALLDGKKVVIKCAASATDSVGVTFKMLDRLDSVIYPVDLCDYGHAHCPQSFVFLPNVRDPLHNGIR